MATAYRPITKQEAAKILSVSLRTIDNHIADGTLPSPTAIGRRVYWHPATFYAWLDQRLGVAGDTERPQPIAPVTPRVGRPRKSLPPFCALGGGADSSAKQAKPD